VKPIPRVSRVGQAQISSVLHRRVGLLTLTDNSRAGFTTSLHRNLCNFSSNYSYNKRYKCI